LADSSEVTSLALSEVRTPVAAEPRSQGGQRRALLEHVVALAVLGVWAVPFTRAVGGRDAHAELVFAIVLLPALLLLRSWRARSRELVAAFAIAAAALSVCLLAPSGWWGADVAGGYVLAAAAFVGLRRYVRDVERVEVVAVAVCLAGLYQFSQAFLPWWGSRNAATEMSGTFYWHNPYAAFLLPAAIIGLGLVVAGRSPLRLVGWCAAPVGAAGVVFSSSRAALGALVVGWALVIGLSLLARRNRAPALGLVGLAIALCAALPGPPLFPHYSSPFAGTEARAAAGETLTQNGMYRMQFWHEAASVARHHPLTGSGYHTLATASAYYTPSGWARSQLAHNGYLQPFADGGLLLGVPFLVGIAGLLLWALRRAAAPLRRRERNADSLLYAAIGIAVLAALAHSAVDFDWSHPAILVELAVLGACVAPTGEVRAGWHRFPRSVALAGLVGCLGVSVPALHQWQANESSMRQTPSQMLVAADAPFGDFRPAQRVLQDAIGGTPAVTDAQARAALQLTGDEATVDLHLALLREAVAAKLGIARDAVSQARTTLSAVHGSTAPYTLDLATVMAEGGHPAAAQHLLRTDLANQVATGQPTPDLAALLTFWADRFGRGTSYACLLQQVSPIADGLVLTQPRGGVTCQGRSVNGRSQTVGSRSKGHS
jgi:O-antigen ligase